MITIQEARGIVEKSLRKPLVRERRLPEAQGLFLAEDIPAPEPMPRFSNSAMDGYAVALTDGFDGKLPLTLPVIGESRAGVPYKGTLPPGSSVLISTGGLVPEGTTLIVPVEDTDAGRNSVRIDRIGKAGNHIRLRGEEVKPGEVIAGRGNELTPPLVAWLSAFGIRRVKIFAPPEMAVLTTGQELVKPGVEPGEGQIRNSNQIFFESFLKELNIVPVLSEVVPDSLQETTRILKKAKEKADIICISGGVSVGRHDHVKTAAEKLGFQRKFWRVAQKPGKPLYFATDKDVLLFGLPGNPLSAVMNLLLYVYPAIRTLTGDPEPELQSVPAKFANDISLKPITRDRLFLVKIVNASVAEMRVEPVDYQKSYMLSGISAADGFIIIPAAMENISPQQEWMVRLFPWHRRVSPVQNSTK